MLGFYFWALSAGYLKSDPVVDPEAAASGMDMVIALVPVVTLSWSVLVYYIGLGSVTYITVAELYLDEVILQLFYLFACCYVYFDDF